MTRPGFTIDASELTEAAAGLERATDAIDRVAPDILEAWAEGVHEATVARARRHRRTGRLERNIRLVAGPRVELTGMIAPILVHGSRPHTIRPTRAHALAIRGRAGARPFAERVEHPGTRPDPILARGVADAGADTEAALERGAARLAHELADIVEG